MPGGTTFPGTSRTIVTSAARGSTGNSGAIRSDRATVLNLAVSVTAQSGTTPTLDFSVEWSYDGTNFFQAQPADSFTQITTVVPTTVVKRFDIKGPQFRLVWTLGGGTPNYTFSAIAYDDRQD